MAVASEPMMTASFASGGLLVLFAQFYSGAILKRFGSPLLVCGPLDDDDDDDDEPVPETSPRPYTKVADPSLN